MPVSPEACQWLGCSKSENVRKYLKTLTFAFHFRIVEEYMSDSVDFVITNEDWDDNFDEVSLANFLWIKPQSVTT